MNDDSSKPQSLIKSHKRKLTTVTGLLFLGFGLFIIFFTNELSSFLYHEFIINGIDVRLTLKFTGGLISLVGFGYMLLAYLKGDFEKLESEEDSNSPYKTEIKGVKRLSDMEEYKNLSSDMEELRTSFNKLLQTSSSSKEIDIGALTDLIREEAITKLPAKVARELENKYALKCIDNSQIEIVRGNLAITYSRLRSEVAASARRSNLNLVIGIGVTVVAAFVLLYSAFEAKPPFEDITSLIAHYIPRIATIIFIEVFAFFFLKLYKAGLREIKYFQNELTNIELQEVAIEASLFQRQSAPMQAVVEQLIKTERNPNKTLDSKKDEDGSNLNVKDVNSVLETLSKITKG